MVEEYWELYSNLFNNKLRENKENYEKLKAILNMSNVLKATPDNPFANSMKQELRRHLQNEELSPVIWATMEEIFPKGKKGKIMKLSAAFILHLNKSGVRVTMKKMMNYVFLGKQK